MPKIKRAGKGIRHILNCERCHKEFEVHPYRVREGARYCSLSCSSKGNKRCLGHIPWNKGKPWSEETKEKMRQAKLRNPVRYWKGRGKEKVGKMPSLDKHHNWRKGISFEPYGLEFNKKLKESIRERDNHRCQECFRHQSELRTVTGRKYKLHVHHIDFNKSNNSSENLISLCASCHGQTQYGRDEWISYYQDKMGEIRG